MIGKLHEIYKEDKFKARVTYFNDPYSFSHKTIMLYSHKVNHYNIVTYVKTYGINKNNIIYSNERKDSQINISKGKYYLTKGSFIKPLTPNDLRSLPMEVSHKFYDLTKIFSIYEPDIESNYDLISNLTYDLSFNKIYKNKLTNQKNILKEYYGFNNPTNKLIHKCAINQSGGQFKNYKDYIINSEAPNKELFNTRNYSLLYDSVKMAKTVNKKINLKWSPNRLKAEHDKMAKEITLIVMESTNRDLTVSEIFLKVDELTSEDFRLLKTTKDTALEGLKYNHCVATYTSKIDNGYCGIFNYKESTIELYVHQETEIKILQHVSFSNSKPEQNIIDEVLQIINEVNNNLSEECFLNYKSNNLEELPF